MYLLHLSLTNFRNFARLDINVPQGAVLLVGANAQGKTSLLEAVYYLATFTSFHSGSDRQLINFIAGREPMAVARLVAEFCRSDTPASRRTHQVEVRIIQEANGNGLETRTRKEVLLDGVKGKLADSVGFFNAVLFLPQSLRVIEGSPDERRRYINLALSQVIPRYSHHLAEYSQALTQRNALLKQLNERASDPDQLNYWDSILAASGARLIYARIQAIQELEDLAGSTHSRLTRGSEVFRLSYVPAYDPIPQAGRQYALPIDAPLDRSAISVEKIQQGFEERLTALRGEEISRGVTTIGPHRDDIRFISNGIDLETYGSRGQARSAMLSLKLAEVAWMKEKTGQWPVLLLDEVLAELDQNRREDLLAHLAGSEQILMTTTDLGYFSADYIKTSSLWNISSGRVSEVNNEQ